MKFPLRLVRLWMLVAATAIAALGAEGLTPDETRLVAAAEDVARDFATDLRAAVEIDSATENLAGVRRMGEHFRGQLAALGFDSRFVELPAETRRAGHLVAEHRGTRGKRVLMIGHLDTVCPGGTFRQEGTRVWGAGVADMKGGDLVIIHALRALHRAHLLDGSQIVVVMTGDEESVGDPAEVTRRDLREAAGRSDVALAFESAMGNTGTIGRRGTASWELEVQAATGHSAGIFSSGMGSGAIFEAARILSGFYAEARKLDGLTMNPALIVGGAETSLTRLGGTVKGKTNIIPQSVLVRGDVRFLSAEQLRAAQAAMQGVLSAHLPRTSATLKFKTGYPAMEPSEANKGVLQLLDRASRDLGYGEIVAGDPRSRGAGDVAFVSPPLPALDGLGLAGTGAHAADEVSDIADAPELIKRTALLLYRLTR